MDKKKLVKIIVPICIALIIAGIWFLKNHDADMNGADPSQSADIVLVTPKNDEDFTLNASEINMDMLKGYGLPIIIDFGSDSCLPCLQFFPVLKAFNTEFLGRVIIKYVDVYKYSDAANSYPIQVIPTQIFINADGTPYVPDIKDITFIRYDYKNGDHAYTVHEGSLTEDEMRRILADMGVE